MRRDPGSTRRRIDALLRRCREEGLAATPQRLAVYRALLESKEHPTPEAVFVRVRREMPSLSLATVYKALDALKAVGLVREVASFTHGRRYDANVDRHHHLVCTSCHKVADLYDAGLDSVVPPRRVPGFRPRAVSVQVLGLCARCTAGGSRAANPRRRSTIRTPAGKES